MRERGHGVNRVLDDALEAFIDVLDRHTIADMMRSRTAGDARGKSATPAARAAAPMAGGRAAGRARRGLHSRG
jgi:hypothetical protein